MFWFSISSILSIFFVLLSIIMFREKDNEGWGTCLFISIALAGISFFIYEGDKNVQESVATILTFLLWSSIIIVIIVVLFMTSSSAIKEKKLETQAINEKSKQQEKIKKNKEKEKDRINAIKAKERQKRDAEEKLYKSAELQLNNLNKVNIQLEQDVQLLKRAVLDLDIFKDTFMDDKEQLIDFINQAIQQGKV